MQISRFQTSGSHPGEDFCMQNSILRSKIANSFNQGRKIRIQNVKNIIFSYLMQISRFQTSGSDPGGDFGMQNSILRSKIANSFNQRQKNRIHLFFSNPIVGLKK